MLSSLCECVPISNQRNVKEHVPVEWKNSKVLPRVECIAALMACIGMNKASSIYSLVQVISQGDSPYYNVVRMFPTIWCILLHTAFY